MEFTVYKKTAEDADDYIGKGAKKKKPKSVSDQSQSSEPTGGKGIEENKKSKFVPLFSSDGKSNDTIQLPGRHPCECQAVKHGLVSNCLSCGRIVCKQEGSGPCLFCGTLVVTKEEQMVLDRKSRKSEALYKQLAGDSRAQYQTAIDNKDRLLEYDANCEKRTRVIDDESDYFNVDSNKWLTPQQREALKKKKEEVQDEKHKSRLDRKITFDFAGRKVIEDDSVAEYDINSDTKLLELFKNDAFSLEAEIKRRNDEGVIANPNTSRSRPIFDEEVGGLGRSGKGRSQGGLTRIQDKELMEMSDDGVCLSMHQPWASLLVMGIKLHEGRTWYSPHRGRLWIHAGSKVPDQREIEELHQFYRNHYGTRQFPPHYPTSCLLGCVDVTDVLGQEEYRTVHPTGESASPYVFVCSNPQELVVKFPMSGKHKLFKLDSKIHGAAKKTAKKVANGKGSGVMGL